MKEIWYLFIGLFLALAFFVISTMTMPPMEKTVGKKYDINGTIYSCRKGFYFNPEMKTCYVEKSKNKNVDF